MSLLTSEERWRANWLALHSVGPIPDLEYVSRAANDAAEIRLCRGEMAAQAFIYEYFAGVVEEKLRQDAATQKLEGK